MLPSLEQHEIDTLSEHFRLMSTTSSDCRGSICVANLLESQTCASYLEEVTSIIGSPSNVVTASQFSKRLGYLLVVPGLYALSVFNKGLNLSVENIYIESEFQDQNWLPRIRLSSLKVTIPEEEKRRQWREEVLRTIFAKGLSKVWRSISKDGCISPSILWENTAIYVYWLYEKRLAKESNPQVKARIYEDFHYLIHEAPGLLFGEMENPLAKYYGRKSTDQEIRIRKTCCYYYQLTPDNHYCATCPKGEQSRSLES